MRDASPKRRGGRAWRAAIVAATVLATLVVAIQLSTRPPRPDPFHEPPAGAPARPGELVRREPLVDGMPPGVRAWRVLYGTRRDDGRPAVASAFVAISADAPPGPRPVIAWAHGTTGVARGCSPLLLGLPFANVPAWREALDAGWMIVATDYLGLGTAGPHPYLIGEGQARSVLDAVRAARDLGEPAASDRTVVWGHSQGGHAALWTGAIAARYAPDVPIAGIAAVAPATDLPAMVEHAAGLVVGRILSSYVLAAYARRYDDVRAADHASGVATRLARDMAGRCLAGPGALRAAAAAWLARGGVFDVAPPTAGALGARLRENVPPVRAEVPVLLAQGADDPLVPPALQRRWIDARCAEGATARRLWIAGRDHLSVVAPDSPLVPALLAWTRERLEGRPHPPGCTD